MERQAIIEALLEIDTASMEFNDNIEDMSDFTDDELQKLYTDATQDEGL